MIRYNSGSFGFALLFRLHGSAVFRSIFPALISTVIYAILLYTTDLDSDAHQIYDHPYPMGALVAALTFLLAFRANFSYNRYWEAFTAVHQMHSKWMDVGMDLASFHLQSSKYEKARPPAFGEHPHLACLERERERVNAPTMSELQQQIDGIIEQQRVDEEMNPDGGGGVDGTIPLSLRYQFRKLISRKSLRSQNSHSSVNQSGSRWNVSSRNNLAGEQQQETEEEAESRRKREQQEKEEAELKRQQEKDLERKAKHRTWGQILRGSLHGNNNNNNIISDDLSTTTSSRSKSKKTTREQTPTVQIIKTNNSSSKRAWEDNQPPLLLQEGAHLISLLSAVAMSTLRNDLEEADSPLIAFTAGAPWPHVDPDAYGADVRKDWARSTHKSWTVLNYLLGRTRTPAIRTLYNAARPFRVIGGVSDAEIEVLQAARGPYAKVALCTMWLEEFISREHLHGGLGAIGAPIISRLFQFTSDGMIGYNQARKIAYIPFPFPHAQITSLFVLVVVGLMPVLMLSYLDKSVYGYILNFVTVMCFTGLHEVARELENPFQNVPNDIPLNNFQAQFNEGLMQMFAGFHPDAYWEIHDQLSDDDDENDGESKRDHLNSYPPTIERLERIQQQTTKPVATDAAATASTTPTTGAVDGDEGEKQERLQPQADQQLQSSQPPIIPESIEEEPEEEGKTDKK